MSDKNDLFIVNLNSYIPDEIIIKSAGIWMSGPLIGDRSYVAVIAWKEKAIKPTR